MANNAPNSFSIGDTAPISPGSHMDVEIDMSQLNTDGMTIFEGELVIQDITSAAAGMLTIGQPRQNLDGTWAIPFQYERGT